MAEESLDTTNRADRADRADRAPAREARRSALPGPGGPSLGRVAGVEVGLDWSVLIIFALITVSLAAGLLPGWHPDWGVLSTWAVALVAAAAFLASILVHELSHALMGRVMGAPVRRITLFIFGGLAESEREAATPKAEFAIAIVGPITSFAIGAVALIAATALAGAPPSGDAEAMKGYLQGLGPGSTILFWLGPINLALAFFNMVPGFPLDGGRVLRSALWMVTDDVRKATRWAAGVGRGLAWLLMAIGVFIALGGRFPVFGSGLINGLWLVLIGWFLNNAARSSYEQLVAKQLLSGVPVTEVMRRDLVSVDEELLVAAFVRDYVMKGEQRAFPVMRDGELSGVVALEDVRRVSYDQWEQTRVLDVMTPADQLDAVGIDDDAMTAMQTLARSSVDQVPVLDHGHLEGFVRRRDIITWLGLHASAA